MMSDERRQFVASLLENSVRVSEFTLQEDGAVNVYDNVNLTKNKDRLLEKLPIKFGMVTGYFCCDNHINLTSLDGLPSNIGGFLSFENCPSVTSLEGFTVKVEGFIYCDWKNIKSGGIRLILSGCQGFNKPTDPFKIIENYLDRPDDIFECQAELIESGFAEYARL